MLQIVVVIKMTPHNSKKLPLPGYLEAEGVQISPSLSMLIPSPTEVEAMKNNLNLRDAQSNLGVLKKDMLYTASRNSILNAVR